MVDRYDSAKFYPPCRRYVAMVDQYLSQVHDARRANPYTQCVSGPYPYGQIPRTMYELNGAVGMQVPLYEFPPVKYPDPATVAYAKRRESLVKYPLGKGEFLLGSRYW